MKISNDILNKIATDYHLNGNAPDMFIENTCQRYELEWVIQRLKSGSKVLDLGYGDGLFLDRVSEICELTLIEGASELVGAAASHAKNLSRKVGVIHTLFEEYVPENRFDFIIASHVLEHVDDPVFLLKKMQTWLEPAGQIICIVPNRESLHRRLGFKMGLIEKLDELSPRDKVVGHQRVYSYSALESDLNEAGFAISERRGFFTKSLANSQMLGLTEQIIWGLCQVSEDIPVELGANLGVVASNANQSVK